MSATMVRYLLRPTSVILLAANLTPLIGVMVWGWDAFVLLMLYWLETAIIAFWTITRIATMPRGALADLQFGESRRTLSPVAMAAFFTAHAGVFMGVHFLFLWELFSGEWSRKIHGIGSFVDQMVIGTGLWVPLLALFIGRGALMLFDAAAPYLRGRLRLAANDNEPQASVLGPGESIVFGLYIRIVIMQVTIILGAWFAMLIGTGGALAFLILVKTAVDLLFALIADRFHATWVKAKAMSSTP
jgi:hypothetical protein